MAENPPKLVECPVCKGGTVNPWAEHGKWDQTVSPCSCCYGCTHESVKALIAWRKEQSDEAD